MKTEFHILLLLILTTIGGTSAVTNSSFNRIFGGEVIEPNSYPYNVGLFLVRANFSIEFCGGALVSVRHILTAAHCMVNLDSVTINLGAHARSNPAEPGRVQFTINGKTEQHMLIPHENFDEESLRNNIGIILTKQFELSEIIKPVQLPSQQSVPTIYTDLNAHLVGWGLAEGSTNYEQFPRHAQFVMLAPNICHHYYASSIKSEIICSDGVDRIGGCKGDEGSPLTFYNESEPILIGIMSFYSDLGCNSRWPTVYTKVAAYLDWIHDHMTETTRR